MTISNSRFKLQADERLVVLNCLLETGLPFTLAIQEIETVFPSTFNQELVAAIKVPTLSFEEQGKALALAAQQAENANERAFYMLIGIASDMGIDHRTGANWYLSQNQGEIERGALILEIAAPIFSKYNVGRSMFDEYFFRQQK